MNLAALQALGVLEQPKAFCLPLEWLDAFHDTPLVWVLQAHAAAVPEGEPSAFVGISERALAKQSGHDAKYLRAKRRWLLKQGILEAAPEARGEVLRCRLHWEKLASVLVEISRRGAGHSPQVRATDCRGGAGHSPQVRATDCRGGAGHSPQSEPPIHKERAPAPAFVDFDFDSIIDRLQNCKKSDFDPDVFELTRRTLHNHQNDCSNKPNPNAPDDQITVELLAIVGGNFRSLHRMLDELARQGKAANENYAWYRTVALQRLGGLAPAQSKELLARVAAHRKPPASAQRLQTMVAAAAPGMGGRR